MGFLHYMNRRRYTFDEYMRRMRIFGILRRILPLKIAYWLVWRD